MTRRTLAAAVVAAALAPLSAAAQHVGDCEVWQANARNVVWEAETPTYGNGAIRFVLLDTEAPATAAYYLMVIYPAPDEAFEECRLVASVEGLGFAALGLHASMSRYDPAEGLTLSLPAAAFLEGGPVEGHLDVVVNRATGEVRATMR